MQVKKTNKEVGTVKKFFSSVSWMFGAAKSKDDAGDQEVSHLVQDRQLSVLTYLPRWEGFFTEGATEKISPTDAIDKLDQVLTCTAWPMVKTSSYGYKTWNPTGFDGNEVRYSPYHIKVKLTSQLC